LLEAGEEPYTITFKYLENKEIKKKVFFMKIFLFCTENFYFYISVQSSSLLVLVKRLNLIRPIGSYDQGS
jgi:hypothetical protein